MLACSNILGYAFINECRGGVKHLSDWNTIKCLYMALFHLIVAGSATYSSPLTRAHCNLCPLKSKNKEGHKTCRRLNGCCCCCSFCCHDMRGLDWRRGMEEGVLCWLVMLQRPLDRDHDSETLRENKSVRQVDIRL